MFTRGLAAAHFILALPFIFLAVVVAAVQNVRADKSVSNAAGDSD